jgi:SAM-dependent methyltransferase
MGNRILSRFENAALGTELSEFHSGYRAYRVAALEQLPFEQNSDGFNFDTQIIIQMHDAGFRIKEIPIPTYYGDEVCYVDGLGYAAAVTKDVVAYRMQKAGFGDGSRVSLRDDYQMKESEESSHGRIFSMLRSRPPSKILDLGCSGGLLDDRLLQVGHSVVGVDVIEIEGVRDRVNDFMVADLNQGIPKEAGEDFDYVIAGDVLEHLNKPENMLADVAGVLKEGGSAIISVPNFSHWYPRFRTFFGFFGYDQRGILDEGHVRFFTRRSILRLVKKAGFKVESFQVTGLPLEVLGVEKTGRRLVRLIESFLLSLWPTMFGYQFILEIAPESSRQR